MLIADVIRQPKLESLAPTGCNNIEEQWSSKNEKGHEVLMTKADPVMGHILRRNIRYSQMETMQMQRVWENDLSH